MNISPTLISLTSSMFHWLSKYDISCTKTTHKKHQLVLHKLKKFYDDAMDSFFLRYGTAISVAEIKKAKKKKKKKKKNMM